MKSIALLVLASLLKGIAAFVPVQLLHASTNPKLQTTNIFESSSKTVLSAMPPDLDVIGLVAGQENYGLAAVLLGEGIYSFVQAPSMANIRILIPPVIAAGVLVAVSGPLITSGDLSSVGTGLWVATAVSTLMGASYVLRLMAPFAMVPKEIAALGLLVAAAGFFSFGQNLIVDGFISLPSIPLPGIPMPPSDIGLDRGVYFG
jgi:hypothetical protein